MTLRRITAAFGAAGLVLALAAPPARAQAPAAAAPSFTTAQLARACGPAAADANAIAARSVCFAVLVTVGQAHAMYTTGRRDARPAFCVPDPSPTLDAVAAGFVSWAAANPQYAETRAVEGVLRFANTTYPCAPARRR